MNEATQETPLPDIVRMVEQDGYVVLKDALNPAQVAALNVAYDRQLESYPTSAGTTRIEVKRILERDPVFEFLMDHPPAFRVARAILGYDIELASGGELDHKLPHTPAYIGWHSDFQWMTNTLLPRQMFWIRCTYFLSEVTAESGPFTLLPKTHLRPDPCPDNPRGADGEPLFMDGQIGITGPAGACLINNTEIWHTNSPNRSDLPRQLIMILYKHAYMKSWQDGYEISPEFAAQQTDPLRRQLTGGSVWHNGASHFPASVYPLPGIVESPNIPHVRGATEASAS